MTRLADIEIRLAPVPDGPADLSLLSATERERHVGMDPGAGRAFACGRALLRQMLGAVLALPPENVMLTQSGAGRVALVSAGAAGPHFSVSHTQYEGRAWVTVAVSRDLPVGIDIEAPGRALDWRRTATRRYHPDEMQRLASLPEGEARQAFFDLWTQKEALVKLRDGKLLPTLAALVPADVWSVTRRLSPLPLTCSLVVDGPEERSVAWHLPGDRA
ncbi:4'-phosphopantetheinyl transferase family protein [Gimibacter soli]|uniref:4'-phosphopantetheinyl transferase superfamily protein n=1 Tax=Gimibacter soli TaxID=3024400 RepID=A0AAE9XS27_9PROT|nr:4'-phosphopantetheinyl transferase superfamily protein [Gimibacter soli]WCL55099.1 4'-phosphopantetheinyl transferase superfamily protein [Gimibacter soli]